LIVMVSDCPIRSSALIWSDFGTIVASMFMRTSPG
jgi:hypothetical protein